MKFSSDTTIIFSLANLRLQFRHIGVQNAESRNYSVKARAAQAQLHRKAVTFRVVSMIDTSSNAPESDSGGVGIPTEKRCAAVRFREASAIRR